MFDRGQPLEAMFGGRYVSTSVPEEHLDYTLFTASLTGATSPTQSFLVIRAEEVEANNQDRIRHYMARDVSALAGRIARPVELEFEDNPARAWLVFEAPWGSSLGAQLEQQWPSIPEATGLLHGLAGTLKELHARGFAAGDLHPDRIWRHHQETGDLITLVAPGLISLLREMRWKSTRVGSPLPLRELKYISPECVEGKPEGPPADVWALAMLAFELYTGTPFWKTARSGGPILEFAKEMLLQALPSPSEQAQETTRPDGLPRGFDRWFARAVARKPEERAEIQELALFLEVPPPGVMSWTPEMEAEDLICANPKGSYYDSGLNDPEPTPPEGKNPYRDGPRRDPHPDELLGNPKGSFYDDGLSGTARRWYRFIPLLFLLVALIGTLYFLFKNHR